MHPQQYVQYAAQAMQADGNQVSSVALASGYAMVGYQSQFKLKWMATKVHLFTVVAPVPVATPEAVVGLTQESLDHAIRTRGNLRGLQTGVGVIPVLVSPHVTPEAWDFVQQSPKKEFAAFSLPAIVDLGRGEVVSYQRTPAIGAMYYGWMRKRRDAALPDPRTLPAG